MADSEFQLIPDLIFLVSCQIQYSLITSSFSYKITNLVITVKATTVPNYIYIGWHSSKGSEEKEPS
jgi:hypothetical protein